MYTFLVKPEEISKKTDNLSEELQDDDSSSSSEEESD